MGAMQRAGVWLGLMPDDDPDYEHDPGYERDPDGDRFPAPTRDRSDLDDAEPATGGYQIAALRPTSFSDARAIGEYFRNGVPVIMNLSGLEGPDAKRLVDFASGLIFGLRGNIDRIANRVFILVPAGVDVVGDQRGLRMAHRSDR
jgi:cell division inhibitor SepF